MRVSTIAPHAPFLPTLAARLLAGELIPNWDNSAPFGLSDITIFLPSRRARQALIDILIAEQGAATLLPDIRTLGGPVEDEEPFLPPFDAPPLPQAIDPVTRRMRLAELVAKYAGQLAESGVGFSSPPHPGEILNLADSLAELIDDFCIQDADPAALGQIDDAQLPENWKLNRDFLEIVFSAWPLHLGEQARIEAADLRNRQLRQRAEHLEAIYGDRPVIAAGSTGSIPATADLLKAVADLPRGHVILPGLDISMTAQDADALIDGDGLAPTHPQYGLMRLVRGFGLDPQQVPELARQDDLRTSLVRNALAPAEHTIHWPIARGRLQQHDVTVAFEGVSLLEARTEDEEARAIAVCAFDAVRHGRSVGIISPDRVLARRVAAELRRFNIKIDDSAGTPLFQSRAGRLVRQIIAAHLSDFSAVDVMALLRNRAALIGLERADVAERTELLELSVLRGQHKAKGLDGIRQLIELNRRGDLPRAAHALTMDEAEALEDLCDRLHSTFLPLAALDETGSFAVTELAQALQIVVAGLTNGPEADPDAEALKPWLDALAGSEGGPRLNRATLPLSLPALMAGFTAPVSSGQRHDIAIYGLIEARLMSPDVMILAGLNEGVWPAEADAGPWLNRPLRQMVGLELPERRLGQAAHDFEMAMGNAHVLMAYAARIGDAPALPSRLVQRLLAFAGDKGETDLRVKGTQYLKQAQALDYAAEVIPATRPMPNPAVELRPRHLSVTDVEKLVRSPYELHAKYVLGLRPLLPLGTEPDFRERGQMVHDVFGRFVDEGHDPAAPDAHDTLMAIAAAVTTEMLPGHKLLRVLWLKRMARLGQAFLDFESGREGVAERRAEIRASIRFMDNQSFGLSGRADRVDVMADGSLAILDFKTGSLPNPAEREALLAPQLPLEAQMAIMGGFEGLHPAPVSTLQFIETKFGGGEIKPNDFLKDGDIPELADAAFRKLQAHIQAMLFNAHPLAMNVLPKDGQAYEGDYDHLARLSEWSLAEDGEGE